MNFKKIIPKGTITWSTMRQQTNEAEEVYYFRHSTETALTQEIKARVQANPSQLKSLKSTEVKNSCDFFLLGIRDQKRTFLLDGTYEGPQ